MRRLPPLAPPALLAAALLAGGCGSSLGKAPTPAEVAAFKGKEITPEQKARGMAAAMNGPGKSAARY